MIDVREISPRVRHTVIFQLFEHLDDLNTLQLIADHDPWPLRFQLEVKHRDRCRWMALAAQRAIAKHNDKQLSDFNMAA